MGTFFLAMIAYDEGKWFYGSIDSCFLGDKVRVELTTGKTSTRAHCKGMLFYFGLSTAGCLMTFFQLGSPLLAIPVFIYLVLCAIALDS